MPGIPAAKPFDLCAGHPALDFVNSLDLRFRPEPVELLRDYRDLLRFAEQSGLLGNRHVRLLAKASNGDAAARALQSARDLREAAASVFYGVVDGHSPTEADVRVLEQQFLSAGRHRELQWEPATKRTGGHAGIAWDWGRFQNDVALPVWILSQLTSDLMLSDATQWLRTCQADTCRWLFLDTSKNHTRRWCNMKVCGNRMKARRFQALHS